MKEIRKFRCKTEELPVIASYLQVSFTRDQEEFAAYSPNFDSTYLSNYESLLTAVDEITSASLLSGEKKMITSRMHENIGKLRPLLNRLEGYVNRAEELTIAADDFGFTALRNEMGSRNVEGVLFFAKSLMQLVDANFSQLAVKGCTPELQTEISGLIQAIKNDNILQQQKLSEAAGLADSSVKTMNELWAKMADIMDTGKRLYKFENTYKLADYTLSTLLTQVNREGKRKASPVEEGVTEG